MIMDNLQFNLVANTVVNPVVNTIKKYLLPLALLLGSMVSMPAYAWPDVDHMNMCGAPAKVARSYAGDFKSWAAYDNYVAKRGKAHYFRTMCPQVKAVKNYKKVANVANKVAKRTAKKAVKRTVKKRAVRKSTPRIARSTKAKSFKRRVKYNEKADCVRVDRMNASGAAVRVVRRR